MESSLGCEETHATVQYELREPDEDGCNWSRDLIINCGRDDRVLVDQHLRPLFEEVAKDGTGKSRLLEETGYFWWNDIAVASGLVAPASAVVGKLSIDEDGNSHLELEGVFPNELGPMAHLAAGRPCRRASASMGF